MSAVIERYTRELYCNYIHGSVKDSEWTLVKMTDQGIILDEDFLAESGVTGSIGFEKEAFTLELQGNVFEGTYVLDGTGLTLTIGEETISAVRDDGVITMTIDGAVLVFTENE